MPACFAQVPEYVLDKMGLSMDDSSSSSSGAQGGQSGAAHQENQQIRLRGPAPAENFQKVRLDVEILKKKQMTVFLNRQTYSVSSCSSMKWTIITMHCYRTISLNLRVFYVNCTRHSGDLRNFLSEQETRLLSEPSLQTSVLRNGQQVRRTFSHVYDRSDLRTRGSI